MYFNSTDTQCHNGYKLFVQVPFENVFNLFFFCLHIQYIYTVCMCVCMYVKWMHTAVSLSILTVVGFPTCLIFFFLSPCITLY